MTTQLQGFIRERRLRPAIIPVSHSVLWGWVKQGRFPAPIKLSERITAWRVAEVQQWIETKKGEQNV